MELRSLYQALRTEDAQRAPSFAQSLRALPPHAQVGYLRALMITAALVAIGIVAGVNALLHREPAAQPRSAAPPAVQIAPAVVAPPVAKAVTPAPGTRRRRAAMPKAPKIEDWVSPTDAWLSTPGSEFRSTLPSLHYNAVSLK